MKRSDESLGLSEAINLLQIKQSQELIQLKDQFHLTYESLKPINLIKHTFKEVAMAPEIKDGMLNSAIGLTTGYFTKAILIGSSVNPVKKILGSLLQFTIATLVARNTESIKVVGKVILDKIFKKQMEAGQKVFENENGFNQTR